MIEAIRVKGRQNMRGISTWESFWACAAPFVLPKTWIRIVSLLVTLLLFGSQARSQAPAITSANNTTLTQGTSGSFTVTTTGSPTPTLSEAGSLPSGVSFNTSTGVLSGTPGTGTVGDLPNYIHGSQWSQALSNQRVHPERMLILATALELQRSPLAFTSNMGKRALVVLFSWLGNR